MRLNTLTNQNFHQEDLLSEAPKAKLEEIEITKPYGISDEEFTDEYKARLKRYKKTQPDLFHRIMNGL